MGVTINERAASVAIIDDVRESVIKSSALQGKWEVLATEHLVPVLKMFDGVDVQLGDARKTALPFVLALETATVKARKVVGKVADDVWNAIGRPAHDTTYDILFPGGIAFYVEGEVHEQPDRIGLLIELLGSNLHPNLPPALAQSSSAALKIEADGLRKASLDAGAPQTKVILLERMKRAMGRSAALKLAGFKRALKAAGFSEAEIHTVIPDHGKAPSKKKAPAPATPPAAPAAPSGPAEPPSV